MNISFIHQNKQIFIGQLWRLTSGGRLENQNGKWFYSSKRWNVPEKGKRGAIKDQATGKVLSLLSFMKVDLQARKDLFGKEQCMWRRSKADSDGWFRLTITLDDVRYLCAERKSKLIITGL